MSEINMPGIAGSRHESNQTQRAEPGQIKDVLVTLAMGTGIFGLLAFIFFELSSKVS